MRMSAKTYGALCFAIALGVGLLTNDSPYSLPWSAGVHAIATIGGDASSIAKAALDISQHGGLSPGNRWVTNLWPPGLMLLEAFIIKLFGVGAPLVLALQVLASLCLAVSMVLQRSVLRKHASPLMSCVLPVTLLLFPMARSFMLQPFGVTLGETFSISLFLSGFCLVILSVRRGQLHLAVFAGAAFALSAYFRSQYELLVLSMSAFGVVWAIFAIQVRRMILTCVVVATVLMVPWRIHNFLETGSVGWVHTSSLIVANSMTPEDYLLSHGAGFVVKGGGSLACRFEPSSCWKTDNANFYRAFLLHAPEWLAVKASLLGKYWFDVTKTDSEGMVVMKTASNIFFLVCLVCLIPLALQLGSRDSILMWQIVSFFAAFLVIFALVHFEYRYFYLVKIFSFVSFAHLWCLARSRAAQTGPPIDAPYSPA